MASDLPRRPDLRADGTLLDGPVSATEPTLSDGRPLVTWGIWEALLAYGVTNLVVAQAIVGGVIVAITGITLVAGAADAAILVLAVVTNIVGVAGLVLWLRWRHPTWRRAIRLVPAAHRVREWAIGYLTGLLLYPAVAIGVGIVLGLLLQAFVGREVTPPEQISTELSVGGKVVAALVALVIAPIAEEFFFRGILFRSLRDRHGFWPGAIVSSLLFGLVHYVAAPWPDAVFLQALMTFTGLGLCAIYEWRSHLMANVAAHMGFNTIGIVLLLAVA